jgi:hypothetical protein
LSYDVYIERIGGGLGRITKDTTLHWHLRRQISVALPSKDRVMGTGTQILFITSYLLQLLPCCCPKWRTQSENRQFRLSMSSSEKLCLQGVRYSETVRCGCPELDLFAISTGVVGYAGASTALNFSLEPLLAGDPTEGLPYALWSMRLSEESR